jgi:hypothetical protein
MIILENIMISLKVMEVNMTTFKEFYDDNRNLPEFQKEEKICLNTLSGAACIGMAMIGLKANKFAKKVLSLAQNDDWIEELSQKIGKPQHNETKEDFIERASRSLEEILKKKFKLE